MPNACGRLRAAADCPSCDRSFRKQVSDRKVLPVPFDCRTYLVKMLRRQHCARSGEHQPDGTAPILHHHCDRSVGNDRPRIPVRSVAFGGDTGAAMLRFLLMPATPGSPTTLGSDHGKYSKLCRYCSRGVEHVQAGGY
jgi:hypothetical protein